VKPTCSAGLSPEAVASVSGSRGDAAVVEETEGALQVGVHTGGTVQASLSTVRFAGRDDRVSSLRGSCGYLGICRPGEFACP